VALYLNVAVDSAFAVYAHALETVACAVGLSLLYVKQAETKKGDPHR
jgi:hypothetical protein